MTVYSNLEKAQMAHLQTVAELFQTPHVIVDTYINIGGALIKAFRIWTLKEYCGCSLFCFPIVGANEATVMALAKAFHAEIRKILTKDELDAVDAHNADVTEIACSTHDYCDANHYMLEAIEKVFTGSVEIDLNTDAGCTLVNNAWGKALNNGFAVEWWLES